MTPLAEKGLGAQERRAVIVRRAGLEAHSWTLAALWRDVLGNRDLLGQLIRRDIELRYRGSMAGLFWAVLNPLIMLAVYTFVFGYLFAADKAHLTTASLTRAAFGIFAGLIVFNFFSTCLTRAPGLILGNVNYVKKVVFPLEVLPLTAVGSALFDAAVSLLVLAGAAALLRVPPHASALLAPVILLPAVLFAAAFTWLLAALGVFLRDVGQVVGNLVMLLMFLSPVFYEASYLPGVLRPYFYLNPLTLPIEQLRAAVLSGALPDWKALGAYALLSAGAAWLGFACFQKSRKGFADVL